VKGSALTGANVDHLLEAILTIAEVAELKANQNRLATGVVLESSVEKGLGTVATLLIKNGTLKVGDFVIAGGAVGNVKIIFNDQLKTIKSAIPSQPVKVVGLNALPVAGEYFLVSNDKTKIKELAKNINIYRTNEDLSNRVAINNDPNVKNLNLILKTDFHGSLEAIKALCENIKIENTSLNIVRASVGTINESDVNLAKSTKSLVVGFNIKPTKTISDIAQQNDVKILFYNIIYKLNDDIINMLVDQLAPITVEKTLGEARIQQL
jgi:translation initiation factor IF-2